MRAFQGQKLTEGLLQATQDHPSSNEAELAKASLRGGADGTSASVTSASAPASSSSSVLMVFSPDVAAHRAAAAAAAAGRSSSSSSSASAIAGSQQQHLRQPHVQDRQLLEQQQQQQQQAAADVTEAEVDMHSGIVSMYTEDVTHLNGEINSLRTAMMDLAQHAESQGHDIDCIVAHTERSQHYTREARGQIQQANQRHGRGTKLLYCLMVLAVCLAIVVIILAVEKSKKGHRKHLRSSFTWHG
mmetsp:Transcript_32195/g.68933  ORF Transcript_32195/g.68933 Transcript_32195/m.68933 type:complete len:244 (+) Transcript_32195:242-973(+)|eukprot:CAMPEP_0206465868 /NCGR_PEP_ID=MMETSP0324_2-20121206/28100_1 /ASSEMBLY_ACC=CAM_ASM_000836 /TAXON_ID=2866 /ORGANISM="Crypthecodinium cohnii, Strain Seligo" /LENGTH=243 /DNA_ID=CAMNT_0053938837 /DNA_START=180 /DNA_END=911 /DNA_ORIENTATION=-